MFCTFSVHCNNVKRFRKELHFYLTDKNNNRWKILHDFMVENNYGGIKIVNIFTNFMLLRETQFI